MAITRAELAGLVRPYAKTPCACGGQHESSATGDKIAVIAIVLFLVVMAGVACFLWRQSVYSAIARCRAGAAPGSGGGEKLLG